MSSLDPQSTLRKWRAQMTARPTIGALAATSGVLAVAGPFNTVSVMPFVPRLAYWLCLVVCSYGAGLAVNLALLHLFGPGKVKLRVALSGPLCGVVIVALVLALNLATLGWWPQGSQWLAFVAPIMVIAIIVNTAIMLFVPEGQGGAPTGDASAGDGSDAALATAQPVSGPDARDTLLDRLPFDKRAPLLSISVEDHYVRIRTKVGEEMLLMRLSDAVREVTVTDGAQVHRSHWVAWDAVSKAVRRGDGATLTLINGAEVPVSRANMAKLRDKGII